MNLKLILRGGTLVVALLGAAILAACNSDDDSADAAAPATAQAVEGITITDAWARATADVPDATSAIYAVVTNTGEADRLVSVSVPAEIAGTAETHTTEVNGDNMKMVHVDGYDVPANGELLLEQGHNHIMLMNIPNQLMTGDMFTATFHFEHAGDIEVTVELRDITGSTSGMSGMGN